MLYLRRFDEAYAQLDTLKEEDVENFDDLYMDAAETLWAVANLVDVPAADSVRLATQAEFLWKKLLVIPAHDDETLWSKIARCIRVRIEWDGGGASAAAAAVVEFYQAVSGRHPDSVRAKIPLAEALVSANRGDEACAMLPAASDLDDLDKADALRVLDVHRQTGGDDDFLRYTLPIARQSLDDFKDREEAKQETKGRGKKGKGGGVRSAGGRETATPAIFSSSAPGTGRSRGSSSRRTRRTSTRRKRTSSSCRRSWTPPRPRSKDPATKPTRSTKKIPSASSSGARALCTSLGATRRLAR